jgi:hypothetical protein
MNLISRPDPRRLLREKKKRLPFPPFPGQSIPVACRAPTLFQLSVPLGQRSIENSSSRPITFALRFINQAENLLEDR